ncbi:DUF2802 domain-containing protein [Paraglaciecola sp.]|uniref:DUF2802 domain-containing protein n=1 Tax=Paraglaciecola sp. TaxID=1920173 RepID=UPI0032646E1B
MSFSLILSILSLGIVVCLGVSFAIYKQNRHLLKSIQLHEEKWMDLSVKFNTLKEDIHEVRSGSFGISKRVKELSEEVIALQSAHQLLSEQDPQSRFYNKAAKLITDGASLSDIIQECEMPTAEAELLFNLHKK